MVGPWKVRMWSIQEAGVMEVHLVRILVLLVGDGPAGVAPSHLIGPAMQCGMRATFVRVHPAGVEVPHEVGAEGRCWLLLV